MFCVGTDFIECVKIHKAGKCEDFDGRICKWFERFWCRTQASAFGKKICREFLKKGFTGYNGRMDKKASGLGLYLCKGVCEKLGHEIRVVSEEGEGTTVILTLQLEKVQQRIL